MSKIVQLKNKVGGNVIPKTTGESTVVKTKDGQTDTLDKVLAKTAPRIIECTTTTAVGTAAKVITNTGVSLSAGDWLIVLYTNGNTANSATINYNGMGAQQVRVGGGRPQGTAAAGTHNIAANNKAIYYYDGTHYHLFGSTRISDTNTTYSTMTQAQIDTGTATTALLVTPALLRNNFARFADLENLGVKVLSGIANINASPQGQHYHIGVRPKFAAVCIENMRCNSAIVFVRDNFSWWITSNGFRISAMQNGYFRWWAIM